MIIKFVHHDLLCNHRKIKGYNCENDFIFFIDSNKSKNKMFGNLHFLDTFNFMAF